MILVIFLLGGEYFEQSHITSPAYTLFVEIISEKTKQNSVQYFQAQHQVRSNLIITS